MAGTLNNAANPALIAQQLMSNLQRKPQTLDYRVQLARPLITVTAMLDGRVVAEDFEPFPIRSRPPLPNECAQIVARFHIKVLALIAGNRPDIVRKQLAEMHPIGVVTLPDGSTI